MPDTPQTRSKSYRLAFADDDFLCRDELRPVRLQLELLKPELMFDEHRIESTVVLFGGARIPRPADADKARTKTLAGLSHFYDEAREFARVMTRKSLALDSREFVIVTGGGPGVMEAGNRGASDEGGESIGLNIVLPHEQAPNEYVTPELCFNFHYFAIRKMHFLMRARAVCIFPGGFGTLDELFEIPDSDPDRPHGPCAVSLVWQGVLEQDHQLGCAGRCGHDQPEGPRSVPLCRNRARGRRDHRQLGAGPTRSDIPGR